MKGYTDLEQSKKLAEILPVGSADMIYNAFNTAYVRYDSPIDKYHIPAWSLAALSEFILPYIADDNGNNYKFYLSKDSLDRWVAYYKGGMNNVSIHICEESYNMIDVILEMVCWLKKEEYI
jgi:hypothetical protein